MVVDAKWLQREGCWYQAAKDGWRKFELITSGHIGLALQALRKKEKIEKKNLP